MIRTEATKDKDHAGAGDMVQHRLQPQKDLGLQPMTLRRPPFPCSGRVLVFIFNIFFLFYVFMVFYYLPLSWVCFMNSHSWYILLHYNGHL